MPLARLITASLLVWTPNQPVLLNSLYCYLCAYYIRTASSPPPVFLISMHNREQWHLSVSGIHTRLRSVHMLFMHTQVPGWYQGWSPDENSSVFCTATPSWVSESRRIVPITTSTVAPLSISGTSIFMRSKRGLTASPHDLSPIWRLVLFSGLEVRTRFCGMTCEKSDETGRKAWTGYLEPFQYPAIAKWTPLNWSIR